MPDPEKDWSHSATPNQPVVIDHPLYRHAPAIAAGVGIVAGLAVAVFSNAPWWMPFLAFAVVAAVIYRVLRPRLRAPSIEDEI